MGDTQVAPQHRDDVEQDPLSKAERLPSVVVVRELGGDAKHLMVFGHNPGITEFANQLSAGDHIDNLPTCGVFTALFDIGDWAALGWESGQEAEFDYPKNHP